MLDTILVVMLILILAIFIVLFVGMVDLYNAINHLYRIDKLLAQFENDGK